MNFRKKLLTELSTENFLNHIVALENIFIQYYRLNKVLSGF